jgi:hypothetical protein
MSLQYRVCCTLCFSKMCVCICCRSSGAGTPPGDKPFVLLLAAAVMTADVCFLLFGVLIGLVLVSCMLGLVHLCLMHSVYVVLDLIGLMCRDVVRGTGARRRALWYTILLDFV